MTHRETIRREFAKQAASFGARGLTLSSQEYLAWMVDLLPLEEGFRVLDVAAGTGHLSRTVAPHGRRGVAIDMTREMLDEARRAAEGDGIGNIQLQEGDAAALPYRGNSFDMVVSRLALHHFEDPRQQLEEMVRVCKPERAVAAIDLLSPAEEDLVAPYNRLERLRDPSHTVALTKTQVTAAMEEAGLSMQQAFTRDVSVVFDRWAEMTGAGARTRRVIRSELESEIAGDQRTGMRPYVENGCLKFLQEWCVITGKKPASDGVPSRA